MNGSHHAEAAVGQPVDLMLKAVAGVGARIRDIGPRNDADSSGVGHLHEFEDRLPFLFTVGKIVFGIANSRPSGSPSIDETGRKIVAGLEDSFGLVGTAEHSEDERRSE